MLHFAVILAAISQFVGPLTNRLPMPWLAQTALAQAIAVDDIGHTQMIPLPAVDMLRDPSGMLTIDDVGSEQYSGQFTTAGDRQLNLGYSTAAYWFRFQLANPTSLHRKWYLIMTDPVLDLVEVHLPGVTGVQRVGRAVDFDPRSMSTNDFTFTIESPPHSIQHVMMKVRSDTSLLLPLRLASPASLVAHLQHSSTLFGLYAGIVLVTFCAFMSLYMYTRELRFLYFAAVLMVLHFGFVVVLLGFDRVVFGPTDIFFSRNAVPWSIVLSGHFTILCYEKFLGLRALKAWPRHTLSASWIVTGTLLASSVVSEAKTWLILSATAFGVVVIFLMISGSVAAVKAQVPESRLFSGSWASLLASVLVGIGHSLGLNSLHVSVAESVMIGGTLQFGILTVGMAGSFFRSEQQRRRTFHELRQTYVQLEKMIGPHTHVVSRIKMGVDLEQTMPSRQAEAAVLCWDVIGSSQVPSAVFLPLMAVIFRSVHDLLMVGYHGDSMVATGYRVNEAGDGGLITIGFPYQPPQGAAAVCSVAHGLAESIATIAAQVFRKVPQTADLAVGVGIVYGVVEGSYHESGAILYRVEGWPLTLATRYESHRKRLLPRLGVTHGSPFIIHEEVYRRLSHEEQRCYQELDTSEAPDRIRDDRESTRAYFRLFNSHEFLEAESDRAA